MPKVSVNGTDLHYVVSGDGPPCLVMHGGLGMDHTYLRPGLDPLEDTLQLVYYDHRGNGRSASPGRETHTHSQLAADADALATALGFEKVAVLGHSYGGFIALEMALRFPDRVSHLILVDTRPSFDDAGDVLDNARSKGATDAMMAILQSESTSDKEFRESFLEVLPLYFKNFDPEVVIPAMEDVIFRLSGRAADGEMEKFDVVSSLGDIQVPALILVGRDDFICSPFHAQVLHDRIANSDLVVFENSGHFPYSEEPELFFPAVREWIRRAS